MSTMKNTIVDINESTIKDFVNSKRPKDKEIRKQLDFGYSYDGKVVIFFEIRPLWDNPEEKIERELAKIRFVKTRKEWNLYWMRASGKWEAYEPFPKSSHLAKLLEVIKKDEFGCFFG